ncbi:hypothetical protein C0992_002650 [Termitomyces sp. T32_za158]|nr:hypothetical protein C0992_002650 [Termitomyces sp. T32_za158]
MLGNAKTFTGSRKGGQLWKRLMSMLEYGQHVYDGLPVQCERHKDRKACLKQPVDFETHCPDGGCTEPWCESTRLLLINIYSSSLIVSGAKFSCGLHDCPSKCHLTYDHTKAQCQYTFESRCPKGHLQIWKCYETPPTLCKKCQREADLAEKKRQRDYELQQKREAEELAHKREMDELNEAIAHQDQISKDARLSLERSVALQQKKKDLENATSRAKDAMVSAPSVNKISPPSMMTSPPVLPAMPVVTPQDKDPTSKISQPQVPLQPITKPKQSLTPLDPSPSQIEWKRQKDIEGASNDAIDEIMAMTGLEEVKKEVLTIKALIDTKKRQGTSFDKERLNTALLGNPGTGKHIRAGKNTISLTWIYVNLGKTTVARLYGRMLASLDALTGTEFFESTGSLLSHEGVDGMKKVIEKILAAGGGTIFIDEAYQLTSPDNHGGPMVLDYLLAEMENNVGKLVFLIAGYTKEMERFFEHNPGLPSRIPYKLSFTDYTDKELLHMFENFLGQHFRGRPWTVEDGVGGLYVRVAIRRIGRGRGQKGFGNARALRIMLDKILRRQALRLTQERKEGWNTDDFHLTMKDIIGPDPAKARANSVAWIELQSLIGLQSVKDSLTALMRLVDGNYQRELRERQPNLIALNRVFLGSPGTGKTSVAKLYGRILADIGLLSDGEGR